jgi:hypothetical protein
MAKHGRPAHSRTGYLAENADRGSRLTGSPHAHISEAEAIALRMMQDRPKGRPPENSRPVTIKRYSWERGA